MLSSTFLWDLTKRHIHWCNLMSVLFLVTLSSPLSFEIRCMHQFIRKPLWAPYICRGLLTSVGGEGMLLLWSPELHTHSGHYKSPWSSISSVLGGPRPNAWHISAGKVLCQRLGVEDEQEGSLSLRGFHLVGNEENKVTIITQGLKSMTRVSPKYEEYRLVRNHFTMVKNSQD